MSKLNVKLDADLLLYLLSHFECDSHTVHMLTQQCSLLPLTSRVKLSLLTHIYSSPHSLAASLHWYRAHRSHYINSGWTFSEQTSYILTSLFQLSTQNWCNADGICLFSCLEYFKFYPCVTISQKSNRRKPSTSWTDTVHSEKWYISWFKKKLGNKNWQIESIKV